MRLGKLKALHLTAHYPGGTEGADVIALVVNAKGGLGAKVTGIAEAIRDRSEPKYLILNKVDLADKAKLLVHAERLNAIVDFAETFFVSAATACQRNRIGTFRGLLTGRISLPLNHDAFRVFHEPSECVALSQHLVSRVPRYAIRAGASGRRARGALRKI